MSIPRIADCIIAAHEAFSHNDVKHHKAGLLLVREALLLPEAAKFCEALEEAVRQFSVANTEHLEDIDRMGDDPSVDESAPFQPDDLVDADEDEGDVDENDDAASPADEELTDGEEAPDSESDVSGDVADDESQEVSSAGIVTRRIVPVPAAVRHAASAVARLRK